MISLSLAREPSVIGSYSKGSHAVTIQIPSGPTAPTEVSLNVYPIKYRLQTQKDSISLRIFDPLMQTEDEVWTPTPQLKALLITMGQNSALLETAEQIKNIALHTFPTKEFLPPLSPSSSPSLRALQNPCIADLSPPLPSLKAVRAPLSDPLRRHQRQSILGCPETASSTPKLCLCQPKPVSPTPLRHTITAQEGSSIALVQNTPPLVPTYDSISPLQYHRFMDPSVSPWNPIFLKEMHVTSSLEPNLRDLSICFFAKEQEELVNGMRMATWKDIIDIVVHRVRNHSPINGIGPALSLQVPDEENVRQVLFFVLFQGDGSIPEEEKIARLFQLLEACYKTTQERVAPLLVLGREGNAHPFIRERTCHLLDLFMPALKNEHIRFPVQLHQPNWVLEYLSTHWQAQEPV